MKSIKLIFYRCLALLTGLDFHRIFKIFMLFFFILLSCEDFVKIDSPTNLIVSSQVYTDDETASSAIRGVYSQMMNSTGFASGDITSITLLAGRSSDDFANVSSSSNLIEFSNNSLNVANSAVRSFLWQEGYRYIYNANLIIENLAISNAVTEATKRQLEGEARFIRAFCNFYLTNLFGDIPLILSTDYRINSVAGRTQQAQVYQQIIQDLVQAQDKLAGDYITTGRARPNKWVANALLARVYLFQGDWANAESVSTEIISNSSLYALETDLNNVFGKESDEVIWQLMPVVDGTNTKEAQVFILTEPPGIGNQVVLSDELYNAFELGDKRKTEWVGAITDGVTTWHFPFKYKTKNGGPLNEYSVVFRLAEQFLIRAEARARQDKLSEAISDLDIIRQRAALPLIQNSNPSISQEDLRLAVEQERRIEFFSEWGHRWLDLKRTNRTEPILANIKTDWEETDVLYPIPPSEIVSDPNIKQNDGY